MPNHTDVRAYFHGEPAVVATLLGRCRQEALRPLGSMLHWIEKSQSLDWAAIKGDHHSQPEPLLNLMGAFPSKGSDAPFSLSVGVPMPDSLMVSESSSSETAAQVLLGHWRSLSGPRHETLRACPTQEAALAMLEASEPGIVASGQRRLDNIALHGAPSWYEWSIKNWGTKWDAYDVSWSAPALSGRLQQIVMQTAWSPPLPALSAMCRSLGLSCACSFIDEGGGFSEYVLIGTDGAIEPGASDLGSKAHAAAKRAAREIISEAKPSKPNRISKKPPLDWPTRMRLGLDLDSTHFGPSCPAPMSPDAAASIVDAIDPASPNLAAAAKALDELSERSVASPSMTLHNGVPLGHALAQGLWIAGMDWCMRHANEELCVQIASIAMARSIALNSPAHAAWAWDRLPATSRLPASYAGFDSAPEVCAAIGDADASSREAMTVHIEKSIDKSWRMDDVRKQALLSCMERWALDASTTPASKSARPRM